MKKLLMILACLTAFGFCFAQEKNGIISSDAPYDEETFEAQKTKTQVIVPENQHLTDTTGSVKIEYQPMFDQVRIYYECMYVTYDQGEAMNTILECLADFQKEHKYISYRYLRDDRERFYKDDRGRRKAQYVSTVKFSR